MCFNLPVIKTSRSEKEKKFTVINSKVGFCLDESKMPKQGKIHDSYIDPPRSRETENCSLRNSLLTQQEISDLLMHLTMKMRLLSI